MENILQNNITNELLLMNYNKCYASNNPNSIPDKLYSTSVLNRYQWTAFLIVF